MKRLQRKAYVFFTIVFAFTCFLLMVGCKSESSKEIPRDYIRVGVIAGPEAVLMEVAKDIAKKKSGLTIKIVSFSDYTMPNVALEDGSIDANVFQHQPYLDAAIKAHDYDIVPIGKTFVYPVGIYSNKIKRIIDVPTKSRIAIPNDPSNEARALLLLQQAKLIELKDSNPVTITPADIKSNYKNLYFQELDAAQLPRVLNDVELAIINTNYAVAAGLMPSRDALFIEDKNSPYANLVVVREKDKDDPRFSQLIEALHSQEVVNKAKELFKGEAIPAWQ